MRHPDFSAGTTVRWFSHRLTPGTQVIVRGIMAGDQVDRSGAVLLLMEFDRTPGAAELEGSGLSHSDRFGPFAYLQRLDARTGAFQARFTLPGKVSVQRLGLRTFNSDTPVHLSNVEIVTSIESRKTFSLEEDNLDFLVNISVDTEALPVRAPSDHVQRLIYGRFEPGDEGYGIPLHMRIFREFGVPATFYLECAQAAQWGDAAVLEAGRYILDQGFDLQLHVHSEMIVRQLRWGWTQKSPPYLDNLDADYTRRVFDFALQRFMAITGRPPEMFRAGGYQFGPHTLVAGKAAGIKGFSNYRADQRPNNAFDFPDRYPMRPFRWKNGLNEFPITISPEPLSALTPQECWRRVIHHVTVNKTWLANVVIHSWSFLRRTPEGFQEWQGPELADNLRRFIETAPKGVRFVNMSEVIAAIEAGHIPMDLVKDEAELVRRTVAA